MDDEHDIVEALDHNRFRDLQVRSVLVANLWLALNLAAQRGDATDVRLKLHQIKELTKFTIPLVNALGSKEVDNG